MAATQTVDLNAGADLGAQMAQLEREVAERAARLHGLEEEDAQLNKRAGIRVQIRDAEAVLAPLTDELERVRAEYLGVRRPVLEAELTRLTASLQDLPKRQAADSERVCKALQALVEANADFAETVGTAQDTYNRIGAVAAELGRDVHLAPILSNPAALLLSSETPPTFALLGAGPRSLRPQEYRWVADALGPALQRAVQRQKR